MSNGGVVDAEDVYGILKGYELVDEAADAAARERAAIVAWLRSLAGPRYPDDLADRLERGEHSEAT